MNYEKRLQKFQEILGNEADLAFLPISADLQYLTSIPRDVPNFGATLHPGGWLEGAWFTPKHDPVLTLPRMTAVFGGMAPENVQTRVLGDFDDPATMVKAVLSGFNLPAKPRVAIADFAHGETVVNLQAILPDARFISATDLVRKLRVVKSQDEIDIMREAGDITQKAFQAVLDQLKHGMTELDVIAEVDYQLKKHGSLGPSFTTSMYNSGPNHKLIFGERETKWHRALVPPVALLFDFGAVHKGYCYDFGRTVAFGQPTEEFQQVYDLVMASQAAGIAALKSSSVTAAEVDAAARKVIEDAGYGDEFRHRLGHGIGIDVHEPPFLTKIDHTPIEEGMMFTIEPSIMQFESFSARVEDVVVARPDGGEALTTGFQTLHIVD